MKIQSNQYGFPCKTYYYILNDKAEIFHHKDNKWRKKTLKQMNAYCFYSFASAETALKNLNPVTQP